MTPSVRRSGRSGRWSPVVAVGRDMDEEPSLIATHRSERPRSTDVHDERGELAPRADHGVGEVDEPRPQGCRIVHDARLTRSPGSMGAGDGGDADAADGGRDWNAFHGRPRAGRPGAPVIHRCEHDGGVAAKARSTGEAGARQIMPPSTRPRVNPWANRAIRHLARMARAMLKVVACPMTAPCARSSL